MAERIRLLCYAYEKKNPAFAYIATRRIYSPDQYAVLQQRLGVVVRANRRELTLTTASLADRPCLQVLKLELRRPYRSSRGFEIDIRDIFDDAKQYVHIEWMKARENAPTHVLAKILQAMQMA